MKSEEFATAMIRTGVFVGSFNPFTVGHDSVVTRALPLFDRLVIGVVGDQVHKPDMPSAEERVRAIAELYKDEPTIEVKPYYGLAVDFAKAETQWCRDYPTLFRTSIFIDFIEYGSRITALRSQCNPVSSETKRQTI